MRIFLDVDGVLADFTMGAHKKLGIDLDYNAWPYAVGPKGWDWNLELGMSFNDLSEICDFKFWAGLPWTSDGRDILRAILQFVEPRDITLLTTPMPHIMSASGKLKWIKDNLPVYERHTLISTESKDVLATVKGSILIDDNQRNVDRWRMVGGKAILVPRLWNDLCEMYDRAPGAVRIGLEELCRES